MQKVLAAFIVICCLFIRISYLYAEETAKEALEVTAETYYHTYKEPGVMRNKGVLYGLAGSFSYHDNLMFKAEMRGSGGKVDYKNSGTINGISDFLFEVRGVGGYDFALTDKHTLTPYFGIGYRYLNDDSSGKLSSTGAAGYERESNYFYSPIGLENTIVLKNGWSMGASTEYDIFWQGRQISHLSDANRNYSDLKNTQKKGFGARGSVKLKKQGETLDFVFEPFVRYWNIAKSNNSDVTYAGVIIGYGYEPKNNTTEFGLSAGVKF